MEVFGKIMDLNRNCFVNGKILISNGRIESITPLDLEFDNYILPGLIDSHVHIESSMLTPSRFAELVVKRGTVAVVSDPHEISNVLGVEGFEFMVSDGNAVPLKFFFGAPSCVPATNMETSGGIIDQEDIEELLSRKEVLFLSEMMNFPGVVYNDPVVHAKLLAAKKRSKKIDGHAPGLTGNELQKYACSGITTDHESYSLDEAFEKISLGMNIQIREGSAARNFSELYPLISSHTSSVMLCTDDSHPDDIITKGHMDKLIRMGLEKGISIFELIRVCVVNPIKHYGLSVGKLEIGDPADFIIVDLPDNFNILKTYINGQLVFDGNNTLFDLPVTKHINNFNAPKITEDTLRVFTALTSPVVNVIQVEDGQLLTKNFQWKPFKTVQGEILSKVDEDVLKIVVYNRYTNSTPSVGFVKGVGLVSGALASCIAHDSHNIIAVGVSDKDITKAINTIIENKGGIAATDGILLEELVLPIGGIMTDELGVDVSKTYEHLNSFAKCLGSTLQSPFMTLSFLSLLVIPELKLGDKGLFDVNKFSFINLIK